MIRRGSAQHASRAACDLGGASLSVYAPHGWDLGRAFQALAFDERRVLLMILRSDHLEGGTGLAITQLAARAGTSRFTASRHLGLLRTAGLVDARRVGAKRVHRVALDAMCEVEDWICQFTELLATAGTSPRCPPSVSESLETVVGSKAGSA